MTKIADIRSAARLAGVQALYQMEVSGEDANAVIAEFIAHRFQDDEEAATQSSTDVEHFSALTLGVVGNQTAIDREIEEALAEGWTLKRLDSTLRAILRAASYELLNRTDIPVRVIINEYVDVAHAFDAEAAFVNGVLDKIGKMRRSTEFNKEGAGGDGLSAQG